MEQSLFTNNLEKNLTKGFKLTTNNRMEMLAVIKGLEALKENAKSKS